jgi:hydroxymethylbilane synthase
LLRAHPELTCEPVVIKTHGDLAPEQRIDASWPDGAFVGALEAALLEDRIDLAVHSCKDLPTAPTTGLTLAALPEREAAHDVLLTTRPFDLDRIPDGARIGTGSPRRAAQMRAVANVEIVPIRGNVPTRIAKMEREGLDGIVLAAAGLRRLGIEHSHELVLPIDRFVPAAGQGALAVQTRAGDSEARFVRALDDPDTRRAVTAERAFLRAIGAGCTTPVGAFATVFDGKVTLRAQLFGNDGNHEVSATEAGPDAEGVGRRLGERMILEMRGR